MKINYNSTKLLSLVLVLFFGIFLQLNTSTFAQSRVVVPEGTQISDGSTLNSLKPLSFSLMDLSSIERGFLMPRLTSEERSLLPVAELTAGTVIYNTTIDCIEFYNVTRQKWMNICGDIEPAIFTISSDKCNQIKVSGDYIKGIVLNERKNVITLEVNVSSPGTFEIEAIAFESGVENGYNFSTKGIFPTTGNFLLVLKGNGKPKVGSNDGTPKDVIKYWFNQKLINCETKNYVKPDFEPLKADFVCNDSANPITIEGNYKEGEALSAANRIIMPFKVTTSGRGKVYGEISVVAGKQTELIQYESELIDFKKTDVGQVQLVALSPLANTGKPTTGGKLTVKTRMITNGRFDYDPFEPKDTKETPGCSFDIDVEPLIKNAEMIIYCFSGNQKVYGSYKQGVTMTSLNYATINIEVKKPGDYNIKTNSANGIYFEIKGTFNEIGYHIEPNPLKIFAKGTPLTTGTFTYTIDMPTSTGASSCSFEVTVEPDALTPKKLLTYSNNTAYGYGFDAGQTAQFISSSNNFGSGMFSTVKMIGGVSVDAKRDNTISSLSSHISTSRPDVISIGYSTTMTTSDATVLANFVRNGGGLLAATDAANANYTYNLLNAVLGISSVSAVRPGSGGTVFMLTYEDDPVLKGPFGDIRGRGVGDDATGGIALVPSSLGSALSQIVVLSRDSNGNIYAFRHKTLNFVWVGDGGFNSSAINNTSATICPFKVDSNYRPIPKPEYSQPVYNSQFTANALAWLFTQTNK